MSSPVRADAVAHPNATAAFATTIKARYGTQSGYWRCAPGYVPGRLDCWAEIHRGPAYRSIQATANMSPSSPAIHGIRATASWTRTWAPVSAAVVHSFGARGTASANSPAFDWGWLIQSGLDPRDPPAAVFVVDGGTRAMPAAIFLFHCFAHERAVRCRNSLGDELRYPPPKSGR
jgi:hypothetical protein